MRPAIVLLLVVAAASCTTERQYSSYGMSAGYPAAATPAPLDPARTVAEGLPRERIGAQLELVDLGPVVGAAFVVEVGARA